MRVAHVLRKYDPEAWGGVETHVAALTAALAGRGVRGEVHAPKGPRAADRALPPGVPLRRYAAMLPVLGPAAARRALWECGGNLVAPHELARLALDGGLALAHVHTQGRVGGVARTAMRSTGRPYVVSVHGPLASARDFVERESRRRLAGARDVGQPFGALVGARRVLADAARILVFNDDEAEALRATHGDRVVRLDQGVDRRRFEAGQADEGRRLVGGAGPFVLQVGRLCEQKNPDLALLAFARGAPADHHLVFAGAETDPGVAARLEATARALGVADRVRMLGNVRPEHVPHLLAAARLVLVPSRHEAFGLVVLEAWAARRPVLFAAVAGMADLGRGLHTAPGIAAHDVESWSRALSRFLSSPELARRSADEGSDRVRSRFDWDAVARRHEEIYAEALAGCGARGPALERLR